MYRLSLISIYMLYFVWVTSVTVLVQVMMELETRVRQDGQWKELSSLQTSINGFSPHVPYILSDSISLL